MHQRGDERLSRQTRKARGVGWEITQMGAPAPIVVEITDSPGFATPRYNVCGRCPMLKHPSLVLITLMLGTSMAAIDTSIVNVSLPVIRNQFRIDVDEVEWVITAYMISFCLFIPLINWMKSRIGYYY